MIFLHTIKPVILSSDPTGSASGEFYYNSTTGKWRGYDGLSWIDVNSSSAIISSSALISTSAVFSSSGIISSSAIISASVDWAGVSSKPTSIASATISTSAIFSSSAIISSSADVASEVDWGNVTNQPTSIASATVSASVDWSGVSNKPSSIASATISSSALVAKSVDWNDVTNQPLSIASATVAASVDWAGVSNKPTSIASATISSSAIVSGSATVAGHADTASAIDWSGVTNKPTSIASATISSSAIIAASAAAFTGTITVDSTSSATISSSAIISSSAVISQTALHANTASAIDWSGVTSKPTSIASATISSSAIVSASVDWAGVSNKPSTIASATISSSAVVSSSSTFASTSSSATISSSANISASSILSSSAIVSSSVDWSGVANKPDPVLTISLGGDLSGTSSTTFTDLGNASITISAAVLTASTMNVDHIDFSTTASSTPAIARLQWSAGEGTLAFGLGGGNIDLNIGQEEVALCYNGTGSAIPKGTAVYISGAQGQRPSITKASALGESTSSKVLGVTAEDIAAGAEGFICSFGIIRNVNTASFAPGTALWLSASNNGGITDQKTYAPNHLVFIGYSIKQSATAGQMFINPQNGYELYELHNVSAASPSNNDIIVYNSSSGLWVTSDIQSKITTASVGYANVSASSTVSSSATFATTASNVLVSPSAIYADRIDFVTSPVSAASVGRMTWNATSGTVELGMDNGVELITALIGQSLYVKATNKDSASMTRGDVVYISGAIGQRVAIKLASASANGIDKSPIGMCAENIAVNDSGFVIVKGTLSGVNTQAFTEGDAVWLSASAGKITNVRPPAPYGANVIGHVINSNIANGSINVTVIDGAKLSFLNDVVLTASTFSNNDVLAYNLSASYWENTSIQNKITTASVGYANVAGHASTASAVNASQITGTTLPAAIVSSSLTSVGTLSYLAVSGSAVLNQLAEVRISSSTGFFDIHGGLRVGDYNNIVQSGDKGIIFTDGTANTGGFVIAPWSDQNYGIRISAASLVAINGNLNVDSGALYVDHINNRVGVNTTNPSQSLAVVGTASITSTLNVGSTTTISSTTGRVSFGLDAGGNVNIGRIDNVASTPFIDFNSGSVSGDFDVRIQATGGAGATSGRGTLAITASLVTINNLLNVDSGTLYVDSVSNEVGIGTTSPDGKLDIATDTDKDVVAGISTAPAITFRNGAGAWFHAGKPFSGDYFEISNGASPGVTNNLVITSGGNVGIATTNPNQTLTVVGTASITSALNVGGAIAGASVTASSIYPLNEFVSDILYVGTDALSATLTTQTKTQYIPGDGTTVFRRNIATATTPVLALHKWDAALTASVAQRILAFYLSGTINGYINVSTGNAPAFAGTSDYRLKENIQDYNDATSLIKKINVKSFDWKEYSSSAVGFIAHELAEVIPNAVDGKKDDVDDSGNPIYQSVMEARLIPYLAAALKENILKVEKLEQVVVQLQQQIADLQKG